MASQLWLVIEEGIVMADGDKDENDEDVVVEEEEVT